MIEKRVEFKRVEIWSLPAVADNLIYVIRVGDQKPFHLTVKVINVDLSILKGEHDSKDVSDRLNSWPLTYPNELLHDIFISPFLTEDGRP